MANPPLPSIGSFAFEALHAANDGITIVDMKQNDQPLIYINPAFEKLTGYEKSEVINKNCRFLQGNLPRQQPQIALIHEALEQQQNCRVVLKNVRKNGELFGMS